MIRVGDLVYKTTGYPWPGVVVSEFKTESHGESRVVVECLIEEVKGALHIYSPHQLRLIPKKSDEV